MAMSQRGKEKDRAALISNQVASLLIQTGLIKQWQTQDFSRNTDHIIVSLDMCLIFLCRFEVAGSITVIKFRYNRFDFYYQTHNSISMNLEFFCQNMYT